jgi:hypothetical protein
MAYGIMAFRFLTKSCWEWKVVKNFLVVAGSLFSSEEFPCSSLASYFSNSLLNILTLMDLDTLFQHLNLLSIFIVYYSDTLLSQRLQTPSNIKINIL